MKKIFFNNKYLRLSLAFGLASAIIFSVANFNASCENLRQSVLRLHIIANSDSDFDQTVKLKVRDEILAESAELLSADKDLENAVKKAKESLPRFEEIAEKVLLENGADYGATAEVGTAYFETRVYENFTLPAGEYKSLIIRLGEAKGKNWWCVVFPAVCLPTAEKRELSDSANEKAAAVAENANKYVVRFKTVEMYEDLKKLIKK